MRVFQFCLQRLHVTHEIFLCVCMHVYVSGRGKSAMREKKRYECMSMLCAPPPSVVSAFPERKRERSVCV